MEIPSDAQATKFGVEPLSPDFVFGANYDSVFHMVTNKYGFITDETSVNV